MKYKVRNRPLKIDYYLVDVIIDVVSFIGMLPPTRVVKKDNSPASEKFLV